MQRFEIDVSNIPAHQKSDTWALYNKAIGTWSALDSPESRNTIV